MKVKLWVKDNKVGKEANMGEDQVHNEGKLDNRQYRDDIDKKKYHLHDDRCYKCNMKGTLHEIVELRK